MKILIVNKFLYLNGGSETYILKLGNYLKFLGHEVQYFGMYDERNIMKNESESYSDNIDFHSSNSGTASKLKTALSTIYSKNANLKIRKVLEQFKPDIVHLNNINFQLTPSIIYEIKAHSIPIVQTVHDTQIACPCHRFYIEHKKKICRKCEGGNYLNCVANKCVQNSFSKSFLAAFESYYYHLRKTYNLVDLYICPSKFIADVIIKAGISKNKTTVMHNFSDLGTEIQNKTKSSKKYALYFGRLSEEKGINTLIKCCKDSPEVKFVFAGSGPLEADIKSALKEYKNIEFIGFKTGNELQQIILEAAFSICPSECYDNCPLSVIESMALGTPVIASDLGGTKELVSDGITGLIFKAYDSSDLTEKINSLWNDEDTILKMQKNCIELNNNTIDKYSNKLLDEYKKLLN